MTMRRPTRTPAAAARGQTGFDFIVGMSVFLVTIGFVFAFVPGMFAPLETASADMVTADRAAGHLTEGLLVEDVARPGILNATCTEAFFDTSGGADCRFDVDSSDLTGALGIDDSATVNVSFEADGSVATLDGDRLAAGPAPPSTADVVVGQRVVLVDDRRLSVYVRVW